uniref:Uncharacterized protein n=1 Tax=Anguilla anguilla TaxID=7936 RepID=A0A0E9Q394_ANGAN
MLAIANASEKTTVLCCSYESLLAFCSFLLV